MSLIVDLFGVAATVGGDRWPWSDATWRGRNASGSRATRKGYALFLWLLLAILVSGFLVEGLRICGHADPWGLWSPGGLAGCAAGSAGLSPTQQAVWHRVLWWGHAVLAFGFIAAPALHADPPHPGRAGQHRAASHDALGRHRARRRWRTAEHFGVSTIRGFPRKDLLDLVACTECGRCQDACPAWTTGKPLTPKGLILDLRDHLMAEVRGRSER